MKKIIRTLKLTHTEVMYHLLFLKYYRKLIEMKREFKQAPMNDAEVAKLHQRRVAAKIELSKIHKECEDEVKRINRKMGRR